MRRRSKTPSCGFRNTEQTRRLLGECLTRQGADPSLTVGARIEKLREAETILIDSATSLLENDQTPENRKTEAIQRVVDLYESWHTADPGQGYDAKAAEWRAKLTSRDPTTQPK